MTDKVKVSPQTMKRIYQIAIARIKAGDQPPREAMIEVFEQAISLLDQLMLHDLNLRTAVAMLDLCTAIIEDLSKKAEQPVDDKFTAQVASIIAKAKG